MDSAQDSPCVLLKCHRLAGLSAVSLNLSPGWSSQPPNCSHCLSALSCSVPPLGLSPPKWSSNARKSDGAILWHTTVNSPSASGWSPSSKDLPKVKSLLTVQILAPSVCTLGCSLIVFESHHTSQACMPLHVLFLCSSKTNLKHLFRTAQESFREQISSPCAEAHYRGNRWK